jgi:hypothetical protein
MPSRRHLITGAAGLGYVVGAAVENMGLLDAPLLGAGVAEIRAAHADHALAVVGVAAGVVSLACYVVFAAFLARRWLPFAVAGALLALSGVVANALMIGDPAAALSELALSTRYLAGPFMALFLWGAAGGAGSLRRPGRAIAVVLALTPLALTAARAPQVGAILAFGAHSLWIWLVSLRLLCGGAGRVELARRAAFLMLVVAAGAVGIALLAVPGATGTFFAWGLAPTALAAFSGGVYVGSAAVYAAGLALGPRAARPLAPGAVVLSVSVLVVTLVHLEIFDLHRLQAWAWLVLFAGFALVTAALAVIGHAAPGPGPAVPLWTRVAFAAAAAALSIAAAALWADPAAYGLPPLGGRFAGSWAALLATLAGWAAWRNRRDEAVLPALALIALPAGALAAAARVGAWDAAPAYLALIAAGAAALRALTPAGWGRRTGAFPLVRRSRVEFVSLTLTNSTISRRTGAPDASARTAPSDRTPARRCAPARPSPDPRAR